MSLVIHCDDHLNKVKAAAQAVGVLDKLQKQLDYLDNYGDGALDVHLYTELFGRPKSASFTVEWQRKGTPNKVLMAGGLIHFGPALDTPDTTPDQHEWSVHT